MNNFLCWIKLLCTVPLKCKLTVSRSSILETRFSILDSRKLWGSRLKPSFETFEAVREFVETVREFIESSFETFAWEKQRTFHVINFWHVWILLVDLFWFQVHKTYKFLAEFVNNKIRYGAFLSLTFFSECFFNEFYKMLAKKTRIKLLHDFVVVSDGNAVM